MKIVCSVRLRLRRLGQGLNNPSSSLESAAIHPQTTQLAIRAAWLLVDEEK
jgi:hypothetical protein